MNSGKNQHHLVGPLHASTVGLPIDLAEVPVIETNHAPSSL